MKFLHVILITVSVCLEVSAQNYDTNANPTVSTFAGSGFSGYYEGQGVFTMFNGPVAITADSASNLFVLDVNNSAIRKITPTAVVSTFVTLPNAFGGGAALVMDHLNNLWAAYAGALYRIDQTGFISQILLTNGMNVAGIAIDSLNNLYVASSQNNRIYRLQTNGAWEVFAGSGNAGQVDGPWIFSSFYAPTVLAMDAADNLYVFDSQNHVIRRVNQGRDVTTFAGTNGGFSFPDMDGPVADATFNFVYGMNFDRLGNLLLAAGTSVREISPAGQVMTLAGDFIIAGYTNGPGPTARFRLAADVVRVGNSIFVPDSQDQRIRQITLNGIASNLPPANLLLALYPGLTLNGTPGRLYRIESSTNTISWQTETNLVLPNSPYLWFDRTPASAKKFYRAILVP